MDSLLYALKATIPIILLIVAGYVLFKAKMIDKNFLKGAGKFVNKVALPALLFADITENDVHGRFDIRFFILCFSITLVMILVIWGATEIFMKTETMKGAFIQASYRSSAAILGLAFISNMYTDIGMAPLMIIGAVPLFNIFAVIILTLKGGDPENRPSTKKVLSAIGRNPVIISVLVAIVVAFCGLRLPSVVEKSVSMVGATTAPLALITIGASFKGKSAIKKIRPTMLASFIKLILLPSLALPLAIYLNYRNQELMSVLIMVASPTTASAYVMAKGTDNDGELTSSIIVLTTILSAFTMTGWIFILRQFGYL